MGVEVAIAPNSEELWTTVEAAQRLHVPYGWLRRQVRVGRVPVRKVLIKGRWTNVATAAAWQEVARRYIADDVEGGDGLPYNPLRPTLMTPIVYTGFRIVYGQPPRCIVCGKDLVPGTWWRWYVPASFQPAPKGKADLPELALGCASGHEGARIRVGSRWWIVGEDGAAPRRRRGVAAGVAQSA